MLHETGASHYLDPAATVRGRFTPHGPGPPKLTGRRNAHMSAARNIAGVKPFSVRDERPPLSRAGVSVVGP